MLRRVAFVRSVDAAGRRFESSALPEVLIDLGLRDAKLLPGSGVIFFTSKGKSDEDLEALLERETKNRLKISTSYFVRTSREVTQLVNANPFKHQARNDPSRLVVYFLKRQPGAGHVAAARHKNAGTEQIEVHGREAYVYYPAGAADSKFELPWDSTGRNWSTVLKLVALMASK